jgi:hypothetical protein
MCQFRFICVSFDQNALARYSNRMPLREAEPMLEKMIRTFWIVFICCAAAHAQEGERGVQPRGMLSRARSTNPTIASQEWKSNRLIAAALSHPVLVAPSAPVQARDGGNSALIGVLRKQSAAVRALIAVQPAGASQGGTMLNGGTRQPPKSQLLAAAGSTPLIGAGKTMSGSIGSGASATPSNAQSSPTRHQAPSSPPQKIGAQAPLQTQVCMAGIASVDGQKSGILFSPVPGTEGMFVIQGCGFGTTPGEVFLTGPQYAPMLASATRGLLGSATVPDRVSFQIATNGWSDRQIVVQIDPNASGFYDAKNVTLVVKTAGGQQYQSGGFNFSAAREAQVLASLLEPQGCTPQSSGPACVPIGVKLAAVSSSAGPLNPDVESPSISLLDPGETIAIARETSRPSIPAAANSPLTFVGGTDIYQFHFVPGFELDPHTGVQLRHASADSAYCQSVNGLYSKNGNWIVNYTSTTSFQVSWEEEGCWPKAGTTTGNFLDYASVSAYELRITVLGPRGVSPWQSGSLSNLGTTKPMPTQLLLKQ